MKYIKIADKSYKRQCSLQILPSCQNQKLFKVNNIVLDRLVSFIKFNVYYIVPEPCRMDFPGFLKLFKGTWWFSWYMLFEMKNLPYSYSWLRLSRCWHVWRSTGLTLDPVNEVALQIFTSSSFSNWRRACDLTLQIHHNIIKHY